MAVPTITTISPAVGPAMGQTFVEILGTGFQLPPAIPATGVVPVPNPSVEISFGARDATEVAVISDTRILCLSPRGSIPDSVDTLDVDVTLSNIDQDGVVVPGETVVAVAGYTYTRPNLAAVSFAQSITTALVVLWREQVLANVSSTTDTDWDGDVSDPRTSVAELPAIVLAGPTTENNRFYSTNGRTDDPPRGHDPADTGSIFYSINRQPRTLDLTWAVIGIDKSMQRAQNIMQAAIVFMERNRFLAVPCDPADPNSDPINYELDFVTGGDFVFDVGNNKNNIRSFRGSIVVRAVNIVGLPDANNDQTVGEGAVVEDEVTVDPLVQYVNTIEGPLDTTQPAPIQPVDGVPVKGLPPQGGC